MNVKETEKILLDDESYFAKQVGFHQHYKHQTQTGKITIHFHTGDNDKGAYISILKQTGL